PPPGEPQPGFATRLYQAKNRSAKELVELIKPLVSKSGSAVTQLGDTDLIAVSDLTPRLDQIESILRRVDVPAEPPVVVEIPLRFVSPAQAATMTKDLLPKGGAGAATGGGPTRIPGELVPQPSAGTLLLVTPSQYEAFWRGL